jgi:hypothetical protein
MLKVKAVEVRIVLLNFNPCIRDAWHRAEELSDDVPAAIEGTFK